MNKEPVIIRRIEPEVVIMQKEGYESPEIKIAISDERHKYCPHEHIKLFEHHRKVICSDCGALLDAFHHLLNVGKKENGQLSSLVWLRCEIKYLTDERDKLKKQLSALRSQIKKEKVKNPLP